MGQKTIKSLEKGIDILLLFTPEKPLLNIDEISSMTGLPKSTCYRFLNTLKKKNLIEHDSTLGKYELSVRLLKLEAVILSQIDLARISFPFMQDLSRISGETAQLMILNKNEAVCIEKVESPETLRVMPDKGTIIGLHSGASGKAIMAYLTDEQQNRIIQEKGLKQFTPNTIIDPIILKQHLSETRRVGYAISDQELYPGVKAVAAPIFDFSGKVVASICVAGPRERLTQEKVTSLMSHVLEASREITKKLGGKVKD